MTTKTWWQSIDNVNTVEKKNICRIIKFISRKIQSFKLLWWCYCKQQSLFYHVLFCSKQMVPSGKKKKMSPQCTWETSTMTVSQFFSVSHFCLLILSLTTALLNIKSCVWAKILEVALDTFIWASSGYPLWNIWKRIEKKKKKAILTLYYNHQKQATKVFLEQLFEQLPFHINFLLSSNLHLQAIPQENSRVILSTFSRI